MKQDSRKFQSSFHWRKLYLIFYFYFLISCAFEKGQIRIRILKIRISEQMHIVFYTCDPRCGKVVKSLNKILT